MLQEGVAYLRDVGDHHVEQAAGQSGVLEKLGDQGAAGDGGVLVRLEDDRVAERERRGDGLQGQQEGEVEGADDPDDADGHAVEAVLLALGRRGEDPRLRGQRELGRLAQELLGEVQFEAGLGAGAAQLGDDHLGDLRLALLQEPQGLLEHRAPGVGVGGRPVPLGALGGAVGQVHLVHGGDGDRRELLAVVRVAVDDLPGPGARTPLAVDVLLGQVREVGRHVLPRSPVAALTAVAVIRSTDRSTPVRSNVIVRVRQGSWEDRAAPGGWAGPGPAPGRADPELSRRRADAVQESWSSPRSRSRLSSGEGLSCWSCLRACSYWATSSGLSR